MIRTPPSGAHRSSDTNSNRYNKKDRCRFARMAGGRSTATGIGRALSRVMIAKLRLRAGSTVDNLAGGGAKQIRG
eukprot:5199697-Amphidinium_carterae.1